jgi:hypothetical protein
MGALDGYDLGRLLDLRRKYNCFSLSIKSSQNLASNPDSESATMAKFSLYYQRYKLAPLS